MGNAKANAAREALKFVKDGMAVGLGTGSTSAEFIKLIAEKMKKEKLRLKFVSTSNKSTALARTLGLKVLEFDEVKEIDLAVDGADQVDGKLNLIKGWGGGAIYRERRVDCNAKKFVVIVDEAKVVKKLHGNVPVEVKKEKTERVMLQMKKLGALSAKFREGENGERFITDNGNYILDVEFGEIENPEKLEAALSGMEGVFENGIFTKNVSVVIVGTEKGVRTIDR